MRSHIVWKEKMTHIKHYENSTNFNFQSEFLPAWFLFLLLSGCCFPSLSETDSSLRVSPVSESIWVGFRQQRSYRSLLRLFKKQHGRVTPPALFSKSARALGGSCYMVVWPAKRSTMNKLCTNTHSHTQLYLILMVQMVSHWSDSFPDRKICFPTQISSFSSFPEMPGQFLKNFNPIMLHQNLQCWISGVKITLHCPQVDCFSCL